MTYTRLVAYSTAPCLMMLLGFAGMGGMDGVIFFGVPGGIIEAFVLARFFDARNKGRTG